MARAKFVKKAAKPIYRTGVEVTKTHGKGKNAGKTYTDFDRSQPNPKGDTLLVPVGSGYYHWTFKGGSMQVSVKPPTRSQLTRNEFLTWLYDLLDNEIPSKDVEVPASIDEHTAQMLSDEVQGIIDEIVESIESQRDELQERLDNMPEHLQESSSSGQLLTERIEALTEWADELNGVTWSFSELDEEDEETDDESDEESDSSNNDEYRATLESELMDVLGEIKNLEPNI